MTSHVAIGVGAGLVSALLFGLVVTGSPVGLLLVYIAPLPVLIAALGWHHLCGLLAAATGAVVISLLLRPSAGLTYAFGPALPAWWLAYLSLLSRTGGPDGGATHWYPTGRLLAWVGLVGAALALAASVSLGSGDPARYASALAAVVEAFLRAQIGAGVDVLPRSVAGIPSATLVHVLVTVAPAALAALLALILVLNLWAAAKAVAISRRLSRPWPHLPDTRMPLSALWALGSGVFLAFLSGFDGIAGVALLGALGLAFALQGLALLHDVTTGRAARPATLSFAYALTLLFGQVVVPVLALAGMADTASGLRAWLKARRRPPLGGPPPGGPTRPFL